jgi:DNA-binding CsgD family transcriptional regulator
MASSRSRGCSLEDVSPSQHALSAFLDADYPQTLRFLDCAPVTGELWLLRARALYRSGLFDEAQLVLEKPLKVPHQQQIVADALRGAVLRRQGRAEEAQAILDRAVLQVEPLQGEARAEVSYYAAAAAWEDRDLQRAEALVNAALPSADGVLAAMLLQLLGWIEVRRERYRDAADFFFDALTALSSAEREDLRFRAKLVHGILVVASERIDFRLWRRLEPIFEKTRWSAGVQREHFSSVTCRRFIALLEGDLGEAWRRSLEAIFLAPSAAFRAIAETNAAVVSGILGDRFAAQRHFGDAWQIIDRVAWADADDEERVALTNFAIEAPESMTAEAQRCATMYRSLTAKRDPKLALDGDRRLHAFELMAGGRIYEALGQSKNAVEQYDQSLRIWVDVDYRMRAALVAKSLHRLTGDESYLRDLRMAVDRAPRAWFGETNALGATSPELEQLSKAERNVLRELLAGKTSRAIADTLNRSPFTVNNHTRKLFEVFGVHSRAALIARAAERGLLPDAVA